MMMMMMMGFLVMMMTNDGTIVDGESIFDKNSDDYLVSHYL